MASRYSLEWQIWPSLVLGALLIAYVTSGRNFLKFGAVFGVSFLLLAFLFFGLVRVMRVWRESDRVHQQVTQELAAARALSQEEAEKRALKLLYDSKLYRIVENPTLGDSLPLHGPGLQKFFCRFEIVREIKGETFLDRNQIATSTLREGFLRIGTDLEHTEIVARANEDTIYIIDGSEPEDQALEESFPTIYHYIIAGYPDQLELDEKEYG
jgi:hypothetical protein